MRFAISIPELQAALRRLALHAPLAAALLLVPLSTGCLPLPHRSFRTPVVHGQITGAGRPAAGVPVRVIAEPNAATPCEARHIIEGRTDANGNFHFCPMPKTSAVMLMMAHRHFRWNVCALNGAKWTLMDQATAYTLVDSGPRQIDRITCEVKDDQVICTRSTDIEISPDKLRAALAGKQCKGVPLKP